MIIVTLENFDGCLASLVKAPALAVDCETTGLFPYKKDDLFSIQVSDEFEDYYFNFIDYDPAEPVLDKSWIPKLQPLFMQKRIFMQNAKFDMAFLAKHGIEFSQTDMHDTEVCGRLIRNDHLKYSLDEQSKRELGEAKDDSVMEWLKKNKKFLATEIPGKDTVFKAFHFDEVPYEMITRYGCKDTRLTFALGMKQVGQISELVKEAGGLEKSVGAVFEMEKKLTHVCFEIERVGVQLDREYCEKAIEFESARIEKTERLFREQTGFGIVDSGKCLGPVFEGLGFKPGRTEADEYEVNDTFLETVDHPLAGIVQEYRDARKRANTYFKSYQYFADRHGAIHANMKQAGTKTGRFSYMDPNLQNIPKGDPEADDADSSPFPIRRAFIPRDGFFLLSVDYKQMEFCMMLDEAGQHDLIADIKSGHDAHEATSKLTGLTRRAAKVLNFGLLYGIGVVTLARNILKLTPEQKRALKVYETNQRAQTMSLIPEETMEICAPIILETKQFKMRYFAALPMVENFILQCSGAVKTRHKRSPGNGWVKTWFGRRAYFDDPKWAYKAANAKIQGGCADCVKIAMVRLFDYLRDAKSRMILQVHDELVFEWSFDELHLIDGMQKIMETSYPHRYLPLTCSMGFSLKSFYDMVDGDPRIEIGKETGNSISRKNSSEA